MIKDFRNQITSLLKFLELEYEENLEKFYLTAKNRGKIFTPSYSHVINPLYKTSIGKWKNYISNKKLSQNTREVIETILN